MGDLRAMADRDRRKPGRGPIIVDVPVEPKSGLPAVREPSGALEGDLLGPGDLMDAARAMAGVPLQNVTPPPEVVEGELLGPETPEDYDRVSRPYQHLGDTIKVHDPNFREVGIHPGGSNLDALESGMNLPARPLFPAIDEGPRVRRRRWTRMDEVAALYDLRRNAGEDDDALAIRIRTYVAGHPGSFKQPPPMGWKPPPEREWVEDIDHIE